MFHIYELLGAKIQSMPNRGSKIYSDRFAGRALTTTPALRFVPLKVCSGTSVGCRESIDSYPNFLPVFSGELLWKEFFESMHEVLIGNAYAFFFLSPELEWEVCARATTFPTCQLRCQGN